MIADDYIEVPCKKTKFSHSVKQVTVSKANVTIGTCHQGEDCFPSISRGYQCTCNSLTALCRLQSCEDSDSCLTPADLDEILVKGDALYRRVVTNLAEKNELKSPYLKFDELPRAFSCWERNYVVTYYNSTCGICGIPEFPNEKGSSLRKAFSDAMQLSSQLLVILNGACIAVTKSKRGFFLFDSHARDAK